MKIQTKYSIGDHVLVKADKRIKMICPFCNGEYTKIVNGEELYCLNCYDGELNSRSNEQEIVEGVISGIHFEQRNIESSDEDDKDFYTEVSDKTTTLIEYFVDVPEDYYGNGTYEERKIISKL